MHAEHHEKADEVWCFGWTETHPLCRTAEEQAGKDPGKCFRSLAPVCISVSSAVKFETLNIPPGCTFHGHSQRLARISISCSLQVSFPNATQLVCIPVMALVNGPPSMGDRGMSMTSQDRPFTAPEEAYIANGPKHLGKNMTKCKWDSWNAINTGKKLQNAKCPNGEWKVTLSHTAWCLMCASDVKVFEWCTFYT